MLRTFNPITKRFELDTLKDYRKPMVMKSVPQQASPALPSIPTLQGHIKMLEAKLEAISKCTNVKAIKVILKS